MPKVLMIVSGVDAMTLADGSSHPTGFWAEELAVPHRMLRDAGIEVDVATPDGAPPTPDPLSLDSAMVDDDEAAQHRAYLDAIADQLEHPLALSKVSATDYDAVFVPGGHGPMEDLATDPDAGRLLGEADEADLPIAVLCHGPAALLSATDDDGGLRFAGRRLATFSDEEERQGGLEEACPWFLETRLRDRGATPEVGAPWEPHVIEDGNLLSGQNPASSAELATRLRARLGV
jgi:putative intracellular protease/amidase